MSAVLCASVVFQSKVADRSFVSWFFRNSIFERGDRLFRFELCETVRLFYWVVASLETSSDAYLFVLFVLIDCEDGLNCIFFIFVKLI